MISTNMKTLTLSAMLHTCCIYLLSDRCIVWHSLMVTQHIQTSISQYFQSLHISTLLVTVGFPTHFLSCERFVYDLESINPYNKAVIIVSLLKFYWILLESVVVKHYNTMVQWCKHLRRNCKKIQLVPMMTSHASISQSCRYSSLPVVEGGKGGNFFSSCQG